MFSFVRIHKTDFISYTDVDSRETPTKFFSKFSLIRNLFSVPHLQSLHALDLLLELENSVEERLGSRRTSGNVNIYWDDSVASADYRIRVVVVTATVGAASHRDDPARLGHLIVDFTKSWSHLVRERAGDNDNIGLSWRGTEDDTVSIHVVSRGGDVHHLDGAASKTERQRPN